MKPNQIVKWGAGVWLLLVLAGALHAALYEPQPGFLSELENVLIFLIWQAVALGVGLIVLIIRLVLGDQVTGAARALGVVPFVLSGGFALVITIWIAFGS